MGALCPSTKANMARVFSLLGHGFSCRRGKLGPYLPYVHEALGNSSIEALNCNKNPLIAKNYQGVLDMVAMGGLEPPTPAL